MREEFFTPRPKLHRQQQNNPTPTNSDSSSTKHKKKKKTIPHLLQNTPLQNLPEGRSDRRVPVPAALEQPLDALRPSSLDVRPPPAQGHRLPELVGAHVVIWLFRFCCCAGGGGRQQAQGFGTCFFASAAEVGVWTAYIRAAQQQKVVAPRETNTGRDTVGFSARMMWRSRLQKDKKGILRERMLGSNGTSTPERR